MTSQAGSSATQEIQDDASETREMYTQISGNSMGLWKFNGTKFSKEVTFLLKPPNYTGEYSDTF